MFSFFSPPKVSIGYQNLCASAVALKIFNYMQATNNFHISPEFSQSGDITMIFENLDGDHDAFQFLKRNEHLTGFFISKEYSSEFKNYTYLDGLIRYFQLGGSNTDILQQCIADNANVNQYQGAMLFFELTNILINGGDKLLQPNIKPITKDQNRGLNIVFTLLTSWTKSLSNKWSDEVGSLIISEDLFHLTTRMVSILPKEYILKISSFVDKISDIILTGQQSYSLVNLISALTFIKQDSILIKNEIADDLFARMAITYSNSLMLDRTIQYRNYILDSINDHILEKKIHTKKYIFNGYLFLQDEVCFLNNALNILSKYQITLDKYNAIVIALDKLHNINKIIKEFTMIHAETIELCFILKDELQLFLQKNQAYTDNQSYKCTELYKAEEKYIEMIQEALYISNMVIDSSYSMSRSSNSLQLSDPKV